MKTLMLKFGVSKNLFVSKKELKYFFDNYGVVTAFGLSLIVGMIFGAFTAGSADSSLINNLDFLLITDFKLRLTKDAAGVFSACLTSYGIFWTGCFILGMTAWGTVALPFVMALKGFGIGLSAGHLYSTQGVAGIIFYISVMLVGAFISSVSLFKAGKEAFGLSKTIANHLFGKGALNLPQFLAYAVQCGYALILTAVAAAADAFLSFAFSGFFSFI